MKLTKTWLTALLMLISVWQPTIAQTGATTTMSFSYDDGTTASGLWGTGKKETYDVAIRLNNPGLVGTTIKGVTICLPRTQAVSDLKVWMSKSLTLGTVDGKKQNIADITTQDADTAKAFKGEYIAFDQPYTITADGVYVGYTFTITAVGSDTAAANPVLLCYNTNEGGFYVHTTKKYMKWIDNSDFANLSMQVNLDGVNANCASISVPATAYAVTGQTSTTNVAVANYGANGVQSFDLDYTVNGTALTQHYDLAADQQLPGEFGKQVQVAVNLPALDADGVYPANISVSKVNGQPNANTTAPVNFNIDARRFVPVHRTVTEEFTGTWCGNCPRGFAAMKAMKRLFPDRFIALTYHYGDSMMVMTDAQFPLKVEGYPYASIERGTLTDPYYGSDLMATRPFHFKDEWLLTADKTAPADVAVSAKLSADGRTVSASAAITSPRPVADADYKVELVLVGNDLNGKGSGWDQENYLYVGTTQEYPEPEFAPFVGTTDKISGLHFDDVVLASTRVLGTDTQLPSALEAYKAYTADGTFGLGAVVTSDKHNPVKFDKTKLDVVALLINGATGKVVNAAIAAVDATDYLTGIHNVTTARPGSQQANIYYDLSGRRVSGQAKGVLISNTGRKVVR